MANSLLPILLFAACALALALGMLGIASLFGPKRQTAVKQMAYESGMDPIHDTHRKFDVRFHLVAIAFLVFDVELLFLYPWAVVFWDLKWFGLIQVGIFTLLLIESFVYVLKKGVLEWE